MVAVKDIFESEIPKRLQMQRELAKEVNAVIHFDITGDGGGQWTLDCTQAEHWLSAGKNGESQMTVTCSAVDFEKIVTKKMNAQMAAMQGKLNLKPMDVALAMKLAKLLS